VLPNCNKIFNYRANAVPPARRIGGLAPPTAVAMRWLLAVKIFLFNISYKNQ